MNKIKNLAPEMLFKTALDHLENESFLEGISILELLKSYYPEFGPAYCYLGWINMNYIKNFDAAEILFLKGLELSPNYPDSYHLYSEYLNTIGKYDDILSIYEKAKLILGVPMQLVLYQLGICFEKQKKYKKAISIYEEAIPLTIDSNQLDDLMIAIDRCDIKMESNE